MPTLPAIQSMPGPSDLTTFTLKVDGQALPGTIVIVGVDIERALNRIPTLRLVLQDGDAPTQDFAVSGGDLMKPGNEIVVEGGYSSDENILFKGIITRQRIEVRARGTSLLHVDAKDAAFRMTLSRRSRYFADVKDSDVFEDLMREYQGLTPEVESTVVSHPEIVQYQTSDWDFLVTRAEKLGMVCRVVDGTLKVGKPDTSSEPVLQLIYGSNILDLDMEMDALSQVPPVTASSWDPANQELLTGESEDAAPPPQGDLDGATLAEVGQVDSFDLKHTGSLLQGELDGWAEGQMVKSRFSRIRGSIRVQGTKVVKPGDVVALAGLGSRFNGRAYVSGVRHMLGEGDWLTTIQIGLDPEWHVDKYPVSATPASAFHAAVSGLQIGVATSLEDPDGEDRVKIRIPVIDSADEGSWARVCTLDAGEERASYFRPEIGDEVIVGFLNDDPHEPIILGMLNSSAKPAPIDGSDENHEKGFVTRSGIRVVFNDDKITLTMETPNGNTVLIDDDEGAIKLTDESGNSITMNSDGITIESTKDLKLKAANEMSLEALNLNIKASAAANLEGSASAALKSGGTTEVKGSLVQIN